VGLSRLAQFQRTRSRGHGPHSLLEKTGKRANGIDAEHRHTHAHTHTLRRPIPVRASQANRTPWQAWGPHLTLWQAMGPLHSPGRRRMNVTERLVLEWKESRTPAPSPCSATEPHSVEGTWPAYPGGCLLDREVPVV